MQNLFQMTNQRVIMPCELVRRHIPSCSSKFDVKIENLEIVDVGDYNISETITTTETWFAPFGSVTLPVGHSKNETRISLTVSEIFDRKQEPWTRYFFILFIIIFIIILLLLSFCQKLGHVSPPTGMVRSWKFRHHIKARDKTKRIPDFGGKIPTRWFPMRETSSPL